jgi:lactoylglutathione lyase
MIQKIGYVTYLVHDYDEAIEFFVEKLGFQIMSDTDLGDGKRWILIAPSARNEICLLLAKASSSTQKDLVGNQTGGRVFLFLHTDDFWRDYEKMISKGIAFKEQPRTESYGTVAVFEDLYGNKWDLLQLHRIEQSTPAS